MVRILFLASLDEVCCLVLVQIDDLLARLGKLLDGTNDKVDADQAEMIASVRGCVVNLIPYYGL